MKHFTEEELIEHYYSKGRDAVAMERHLQDCADCAAASAALRSDLGEISALQPPPRDAAYGQRVWQSLAPSLPVYQKPGRSWFHAGVWKGLSYAAACGLLMVGGFFAGRQWEHRQTVAANRPPQAQQRPVHPPQRVVVVVLGDHLERSERLLVELKHADAGSDEMLSPLRDEARTLLAANRICRKDASKIDDPALAPALDHLDHLLAELANHNGPWSAAELERLQGEMSADGLLFEVRVLRTRIPDHRPATDARQNGGTI
jgi:hypothetical protein